MLRWKDSDVEFFVPQLAAVLMSKGVPSRNVHVSWHLCVMGAYIYIYDKIYG